MEIEQQKLLKTYLDVLAFSFDRVQLEDLEQMLYDLKERLQVKRECCEADKRFASKTKHL